MQGHKSQTCAMGGQEPLKKHGVDRVCLLTIVFANNCFGH
jgi:hypothetical protein